ncbi:MAG: ATP-binding region ATPase domain protein [Gemmatimonadetes bacterium]|nr:ATP-binding region ATPase domain protein [Gemmatimonadota bacterium]
MTLRSRLAIGLVTIAIILVGPLLFAIQSLYRLHDDAKALRDQEFAASLLIGRLREGLNDLRRQELALLFSKDVAARDAMDKQVRHVAAMADSMSHYQLPAYARDIGSSIRQVAEAAPAEYEAALANNPKVADSLSARVFVPALSHADSTVIVAEHELQNRTTARVAAQATTISRTASVSMIALMLALLVAGAVAFWLTRSINQPIHDLKSGMQAVADGDLEYKLRIPPDRSDEFGQLAQSFLEMTRQLGELDKLKAEFVSVASHELKTPINVMLGYLQLMEEGIYGPLTPKQQDVHKTLGLQANTLLRLVKQLLDVSRFEAGGGRVEPRHINLENMLAELEDAFHVLAVQREVQFCIRRNGDLPREVVWDQDRINEVLGNLLSNAFKFTPRGGTIELSLEQVDGGGRLLMEVRDTGAGIPPEQLHRIFDKFYQADNQGSAHAKGTGLGLAIAKQIVDAHGGTISCESTLGVGTTFKITLPTRVARRSSMQRALSETAG